MTKADLGKLAEIEARPIPYWVPPHRMMNIDSDIAPWGDKWRAGTSNFRTVAELYTKRNLWALSLVRSKLFSLAKPESDSAAAAIWVALTTVSLTGTRMLRESKRAIQAGTYYLPQVSREIKVWTGIEYNLFQTTKGLGELAQLAQTPWDVCISTQSVIDLVPIPDNQVDYIFTDPPYGGTVQYGELNFVWEAWLGFATEWHANEIVVNETRGKTEADWARKMRAAMRECYRVLKPGRWISLCYHDSSEGTWQLLQDIMAEAGFMSDSGDSMLYIDTDQKSFNQRTADKVTMRDLVINFRKPRPDETGAVVLTGDEDATTFADKARAILIEALEAHPGSTADRLYDLLVSRMVRRGEFERHNFQALLESIAEPVAEPLMQDLFTPRPPDLFGQNESVRWYLHATAGELDDAERIREDAAAARLEVLMHRRVDYKVPANADDGVHYSDLFEHYLPVKEKPRRLLQEWLPEYFYQTGTGAWRPPLTDEERALKQTLRAGGASSASFMLWPKASRRPRATIPPVWLTRPTGSASVAAPGSMSTDGRCTSRAASISAA